jgi:ABC-type sugar transport system ATPase subunit
MIDQNVFLIDENFNILEEQTKTEALKIFSDNCTGNETYKQKFLSSLKSELEHKKTEFSSLNKNQMRATITKTELDMKTALNYYTEKMKKTLQSFCGNEDFNAINKNIKTKAFALFEGNRLLKDSNLWSQYSKKLDSDINKLFVDFNKSFEENIENLEQFYCETIDNAMNKNFLVLFDLFIL